MRGGRSPPSGGTREAGGEAPEGGPLWGGDARSASPIHPARPLYLILGHYIVTCARWNVRKTKSVPFMGPKKKTSITTLLCIPTPAGMQTYCAVRPRTSARRAGRNGARSAQRPLPGRKVFLPMGKISCAPFAALRRAYAALRWRMTFGGS